MKPRLPSSRRWTSLPVELKRQVSSLFAGTFRLHLQGAKVEVEGRIFPEELILSIGFRKSNNVVQHNFRVSITYKKDKDNVVQLINLLVDAAASLFEQLFSGADTHEFPREWTEVAFERRTIYVLYDTVNSELEKKADALLGQAAKAEDRLTQGDWSEPDDADEDKDKDGEGKSPLRAPKPQKH